MLMIKKIYNELKSTMFLPLLATLLLILSFCFEDILTVFKGYGEIMLSPSILLTDYFAVGGMGATFLNAFTILVFNIVVLKLLKVDYSGPIFAGLMMIIGFSFFGKNIINTLPIYLGVFLHCYFRRVNIKSFIVVTLFSSGISPLVSYCFFGIGLPLYLGLPLGIICGVIAGFLLPALVEAAMNFTGGYNLYNVGFSLGVISVFFYGIFNLCGFDVNLAELLDNTHRLVLFWLLFSISILCILFGLSGGKKTILGYFNLIKESGRLISDFTINYNNKVIFLNIGLLSLLSCLMVHFIPEIPLNGIMFGTIIAIIGFAAYGIHILNVIPVWIGALLYIYISPTKFTNISSCMALFFVTCLAPLAGKYGFIIGIVAGFSHLLINPFFITFQGGFDLYNNGFCAGFVAFFIHTIVDHFNWRKKIKELFKKKSSE